MRSFSSLSLLGLVLLPLCGQLSAQTIHGPLPYLSRSDSPFADCVLLETFEDHLFNRPGVTVNIGYVTSTQFPASVTDSVDADDGAIDGSGSFGDSYFSGGGGNDLIFSFSASVLGSYPTRAGLVWTDGGGLTTFEAYGPAGQSLGVVGPVSIDDGLIFGSTAEDRFFGAENVAGISAIRISNGGNPIEVDHLQYAFTTGATIQASESVRLGTPPNPNALKVSKATPPILGTLWAPYVDHTNFLPLAVVDFLAIGFGPPINVPIGQGTALCLPTPGLNFLVPAGSPFEIPIPNSCTLAGISGCCQAASVTANSFVQVTNALDFVLGTH